MLAQLPSTNNHPTIVAHIARDTMSTLQVGLLGRAMVPRTTALASKLLNMRGCFGSQGRRTPIQAEIATYQFSTSIPLIAPSFPQASSAMPSIAGTEISKASNATLLADSERAHPARLELSNNTESPIFSGHRKIIKIKNKTANAVEIGIKKKKEFLGGYKYRLLATPILTNSLITVPEAPLEKSPSSTDVITTTSRMKEKEIFDIRLLQQQYDIDADREGSSQHAKNGINDIPSLRWFRRLLNDLGYYHTETSSLQYSQPSQISMRSRRSSSIALEEMMNSDSYTGSLPDERQNPDDEEEISDRIRVRSVQAASSIDVVAVLSKVFGGGMARTSQYTTQHPLSDFFASSPPLRHVFGRTNIIIQLSPPPTNGHPSLSHSVPRYIAIYRFGAVVFFNLTTKEASRVLEQVKKHSVNPISVGFERREHFEVALQPQLETATGKITADRAMVRELDMNTVGIVSNIMGQTVALDWHNDTVDELLAKFSNVNSSVEKTGSFTSIERNTLFQVVARNNSLFIDMVGKLGIKDRSDTAWHLSQYEGLHEGMRKEFELDERFRVSIIFFLIIASSLFDIFSIPYPLASMTM